MLVAVISFIFGEWHITLGILATLMCLDISSGLIKAVVLKEVRSRRLSDGLFRKAGFVMLVILAQMMDLWIGMPIFRHAVVGLLIANEAISIVENLTQMGVPVPQKLIQFLEIVKSNDGDLEAAKAEVVTIKESAATVEEKLKNIEQEAIVEQRKENGQ
ncbi:holin family protein [Exiguobacterium aurantiacum]|uniref:phage holin family protein n=1 Tax=Exiguobacterium aurantiacum TaxID=33987 RepID=UPI00384C92E5